MKVTFNEWLWYATMGTVVMAWLLVIAAVLAFSWGFVQLLGGDDEATADAQEAQYNIHHSAYAWASIVFLGKHPLR